MAVDADTTGGPVSGPDAETRSSLRRPSLAGALIVLVLASLTAYLGVRTYQEQRVTDQRNLLVAAARQGAVNVTSIDWEHADADIQRILASATGSFFDDFSQRSKPFVDVVERAQSKSVGTVTEAGIESFSGNEAQVLVSVSVETTTAADGGPGSAPRNWRMRLAVKKVGNDAKVSNLQFVP